MKTLHAYFGQKGKNTMIASNSYPDLYENIKHSFWCEDYESAPDLSKAIEATYDDIEAYAEKADIRKVLINRCH